MNECNIIEIKKGDEYRIMIDDPGNLCNEDRFFYPVYSKSAELVKEIIAHFPEDDSDDLFGGDYHNNIIMYCAERGSGKSSAMYTFAKALAHSQKDGAASEALLKLFGKNMSNYSFSVLSPIDPTMISELDLFMRIILSKMFSKLREKWDEAAKNGGSHPTGNIQNDKICRSDIVKKFTKCYRYLDVIYQSGGKFDCNDDLEDLTDLGDSGRFKDEFRSLVKDFLCEMTGRSSKTNSVMVIPIDDADLNSKMAFNIVEDMRKYCIIPNVIILMAVNIEQMHYVLEQHFVKDFKMLIDISKEDRKEIKTVDVPECHNMAMRYVDKVLPAAHQIYLPTVDDFIRNNSSILTVKYFSEDNKERREILDFDTMDGKKVIGYQELLLRLIYNKTGIALVKPRSYLHNILPKTMRGLSHFLAHMCALPDLDNTLGITEIFELTKNKDMEKAIGRTCSEAQAELRKRKDNLKAFKQYFLKNWCTVRLSQKHREVIEILENTSDELKIFAASKLIDELFPDNASHEDDCEPPLSPLSYAYIQRKISRLSSHAHESDNTAKVYTIKYAMKMYFMLFFNRLLLTCAGNADFEKLLKSVNLEAWVPFNGKPEDHKVDKMYGRFSVDYNVLKKILSPKEIEQCLKDSIIINENDRNTRYAGNALFITKMEKSLKKDSGVKLFFDYGTLILYYACDQNPYDNKNGENIFMIRNAFFALLNSCDLQKNAERYSSEVLNVSDQKGVLKNILYGLEGINYLPIPWKEIPDNLSADFRLNEFQLANREITLELVDIWLKRLKEECDQIAVDETLLDKSTKKMNVPNIVNNINAIQMGISIMKPMVEKILMLCADSQTAERFSKIWSRIYDTAVNFDLINFWDFRNAPQVSAEEEVAVNKAIEIIGNFIKWKNYITASTGFEIKAQISAAFDE